VYPLAKPADGLGIKKGDPQLELESYWKSTKSH